MPFDPHRVQAVFLKAVECLEPEARAAILDRECAANADLRGRVEALLRASELPNRLLDQPIVGPAGNDFMSLVSAAGDKLEGTEAEAPEGASTGSAPGIERLRVPNGSGRGSEGDPSKIGRYRIVHRLGQGGFGQVYLARDDELDRPVAIKIPNPERMTRAEDLKAFLVEARILARLDHPNIVPVFDVGTTGGGLCFVVSKFIEGSDLKARLEQTRPTWRDSAELVATIADALQYAHSQGLVHRDIKPANILIDASGKPCLSDFGLALKDDDFGKSGDLAGTPVYMSPEQVQGEGHRVDRRSDVFSLGIVLYELLTGVKPFQGDSLLELIAQISFAEPLPPHLLDQTIPPELTRICQKALSKRASERYSLAQEMAEELRLFLQSTTDAASRLGSTSSFKPPTSSDFQGVPPRLFPSQSGAGLRLHQIVPKGLRSFDKHDADFFLELLPGPRDKEGLPDSIRFWKRTIERVAPDPTFKVGLIYGPSGCGKSSLVKAGLLPRLGQHVLPVYLEATPDETEASLLNGLLRACPELDRESGLVAALASLRRGRILPPGRKLLLVLDQFEQWLFAKRSENTELLAALRQCDGERLQAIVMVRDDFWMAATRFMRGLEIRLIEGENSMAVDLFDVDHAREVLAAFGRAFGKLPRMASGQSREQRDFLEEAVYGLAEDGKVIPVHLALFAETMKGKDWNIATLLELGGTKGVGVRFLEETFGGPTAPPEPHDHRKAAQAVLKALLPTRGGDIKAKMKSRQELLEASRYAHRPGEFDDLIRMLDQDLRLITPIDPDRSPVMGQSKTNSSECLYQLSHDYLVQLLRDWLTREQGGSRRGRAELRLTERASLWSARTENRNLPSSAEWLTIRLLTNRRDWTGSQRLMMERAGWVYGRRALGLVISVCLIAWAAIEGFGALRASTLLESLHRVATPDVPAVVTQLASYRRWADPQLVSAINSTDDESREHLHASLALLAVDATQIDYLCKRLLSATPSEFRVLRDALEPHQSALRPRLWTALQQANPGDASLLPSAGALASYDPGSAQWEDVGSKLAQSLVSVNAIHLGPWIDALRPVRAKLLDPINAVLQDQKRPESEYTLATYILADFAADEPAQLAELLMVAGPKAFVSLFPSAAKWAGKVIPILKAELAKNITEYWNDPPFKPGWTQPETALVNRIEQAHGMVTARFAFCQTMPLDEWITTAKGLRNSGYRPVRLRPFADDKLVRVAAVWTRDRQNWRFSSGLTPEEVRRQDDQNREDGFLPVDVAGYQGIGNSGKSADQHSALWVEKSGEDDARMYVGTTAGEQEEVQQRFREAELIPRTLHALRGTEGPSTYCGVWGRPARAGIEGQAYRDQSDEDFAQSQTNLSEQSLIDVSVSQAPAGTTNAGDPDHHYSTVWSSDWRFEATSIHGLDPSAHWRECRERIAEGYRPVSWSAASHPASDGRPVTASVWHRPVITDEAKDNLAQRQARAAVALARLGESDEILPLLQHSADPRLRSFIINWLFPLGVDPQWIVTELDRIDPIAGSTPGQKRQPMDEILFHRGTSQRRALIQSLGTYGTHVLTTEAGKPLIGKLIELYRDDPDAGIHGATEWTLRQWKQRAKLKSLDAELMKLNDWGDRRWYVNGQGQSFALIEGPLEFRMGSPPAETERIPGKEPLRSVRIPHRFAIAAKEVTVEQFQHFLKLSGTTTDRYHASAAFLAKYSPDPQGPWVDPDWYMAAHYCNWLSEQEGLPRDQWCYIPTEGSVYSAGMSIPADVLERTGYRLPTEAEWEYACRAGAVTNRYYGHSINLLHAYARFQANSEEHAWVCGSLLSNDLGLFDMLGNVVEWCQDSSNAAGTRSKTIHAIEINSSEIVAENVPRVLRGGTFVNRPAIVRSAYRLWDAPSGRYTLNGFRPCRTWKSPVPMPSR
ncbi:protein kinase [Singulisphaera sp. Ch08]|uniref:Protein kinase n=1 Tax=Singulisphaera sp. Ch08 TaxID=3120278 RepID=A0AAU7CGZ7_9BACT